MGRVRITAVVDAGQCLYRGIQVRNPYPLARSYAKNLVLAKESEWSIEAYEAGIVDINAAISDVWDRRAVDPLIIAKPWGDAGEARNAEYMAEIQKLQDDIAILRLKVGMAEVNASRYETTAARLASRVSTSEDRRAIYDILRSVVRDKTAAYRKEYIALLKKYGGDIESMTPDDRARLLSLAARVAGLERFVEEWRPDADGLWPDNESDIFTLTTADWTPGLSVGALVGTADAADIVGTGPIRPGVDGGHVSWRKGPDGDGVAGFVDVLSPEAAFSDAAMLPGMQRWKPKFRSGVVTAVRLRDDDGNSSGEDEADVIVSSVVSINQWPVNPGDTITNPVLTNGPETPAPSGFLDMLKRHPHLDFSRPAPAVVNIADRQLETLSSVNDDVNSRMTYREDNVGINPAIEYWNPSAMANGDCEDYALAKFRRLASAFPQLRLTTCFLHGRRHCVLTIDTNRGTYVLSNGLPLMLAGGSPFVWRARQGEGLKWHCLGAHEIKGVPARYMRAGGIGLVEGTEVLLRFDRSWNDPEIVGLMGGAVDPGWWLLQDEFAPRTALEPTGVVTVEYHDHNYVTGETYVRQRLDQWSGAFASPAARKWECVEVERSDYPDPTMVAAPGYCAWVDIGQFVYPVGIERVIPLEDE